MYLLELIKEASHRQMHVTIARHVSDVSFRSLAALKDQTLAVQNHVTIENMVAAKDQAVDMAYAVKNTSIERVMWVRDSANAGKEKLSALVSILTNGFLIAQGQQSQHASATTSTTTPPPAATQHDATISDSQYDATSATQPATTPLRRRSPSPRPSTNCTTFQSRRMTRGGRLRAAASKIISSSWSNPWSNSSEDGSSVDTKADQRSVDETVRDSRTWDRSDDVNGQIAHVNAYVDDSVRAEGQQGSTNAYVDLMSSRGDKQGLGSLKAKAKSAWKFVQSWDILIV